MRPAIMSQTGLSGAQRVEKFNKRRRICTVSVQDKAGVNLRPQIKIAPKRQGYSAEQVQQGRSSEDTVELAY